MLQWNFSAEYRLFKMKITDAKYMKNENGDNISFFSLWMENMHYVSK